MAGEVFAKLGVNVTNIAPGELYTSLDRGTIDALEWVGPGMDIKMGFHKIAPYYYTGWHEPATDLQFLVNKKAFDKLPPEYQGCSEGRHAGSRHRHALREFRHERRCLGHDENRISQHQGHDLP